MKLSCIIVDDEPAARNGLANDLSEIDYLAITGTASDAFQALGLINNLSPDLVFLDIEMPGLNGLEFLKLIKIQPMVILITAYQQYAINGYEFGVVDYLLKPVSAERLKTACDKARELYHYKNQKAGKVTHDEFMFVKCQGKMEKIPFAEILYVEAANNYVFIHTIKKRFMGYYTLKGMEIQLPMNEFVKVHKSFIVSTRHIKQVSKNEIMVNDQRIPLSKNFRHDFRKDFMVAKSFSRK